MDSIRACGHCDIEPVVDQNARAVRTSAFDRCAREFAERFCAQTLFTNLNELTTGLSRPADSFDLQMGGGVESGFRIAEECLAVCDQVEQRAVLSRIQAIWIRSSRIHLMWIR